MQKRQLDRTDGDDDINEVDTSYLKKAKREGTSTELVNFASTSQALTVSRSSEPGRTSALLAPEVSLQGHEGAVYSIDFDPSGRFLCSGSYDKQICKYNHLQYLFQSLISLYLEQFYGIYLREVARTTMY